MDILTSECKLVVQSINYNSGSEIRRLTLRAIIVRNSLFPDNILLVASWARKAGRQEGGFVYLGADKGRQRPTMAARTAQRQEVAITFSSAQPLERLENADNLVTQMLQAVV